MNKEHKSRLLNILVICGIVFLIGGLYYLFISLTGKAIPCPFYEMTGFLCPTCGITRMFQSIFQLDIVSAFNFNPVLFVITPICLTFFIVESVKYIRSGTVRISMLSKAVICLSCGAVLVFGILRNI